VSAFTFEEALRKAKKLAKQKEHSYKNVYGERVSWKLISAVALQEILIKNWPMAPKSTIGFSRG
jgi:Domain of unknown function (DUF4288)